MTTQLKKIDSTTFFGRAERYIAFSAEFDDFLRGKYNRSEILKVNVHVIQHKYNLKGFVFGNYVTQEERYFFLYKLSKQLEFLATIKGSNDLGKGKLIVGFGADGHKGSLAHFRPMGSFINLNKETKGAPFGMLAGENSFVHEYGHFIDFEAGQLDKESDHNFASEEVKDNPNRSAFSKFNEIAISDSDYMEPLLHSKYLRSSVEVFARLFESTINVMAQNSPKYKKFFDDQYKDYRYLPKEKIKKSGATKYIKKMLNY